MSGPPPFYQPTFSVAELRQAEAIVRRRQAPHAHVRRARLALVLAAEPTLSNPEAGRRLGVHENTVRLWRKRWAVEGFCVVDRPRPGRPRTFSPSADRGHQGDCL
jgi:predicted ArsR family transcriptional regulator